MARKARVYGANGCRYSVSTRINDTDVMRFQEPDISIMVFQVFAEAKKKFGFLMTMLTIMGNHLHTEINPNTKQANISKIMHWINTTIAIRYNKITGHTGHLWRERFVSKIIHDWNYFVNTCIYFARNPERAGLEKPSEYLYSTALFLYKAVHPLQEFEVFRTLADEPISGFFEQLKNWILERQLNEETIRALSMRPKSVGRPKKVSEQSLENNVF